MNQADIPEHWIQGQLLDLRRYTNGTFIATLLGEELKPDHTNAVLLPSADDAQQFVSRWYARASRH